MDSEIKTNKTIAYPEEVGPVPTGKKVVLSVRNLAVSFETDDGYVRAVRGVSFDLYKGETLCIVGESGSGKSVTNKTVMGILGASAHIDSGSITYEGEDLTKIAEDEFHRIRGTKIGMIFQDPLSSLNPIMKIGKQITEVMIINGDHLKHKYDDLISDELIKFKNDERLLQIAKGEWKHAKKKKNNVGIEERAKAEANYGKEKARLTPILVADKAALKEAKKKAKAEVSALRGEIVARHKQLRAPIVERLFTFKNIEKDYADFISERRRYVSELRVTHKEAKMRALRIMQEAGIPEPERRFNQYPFEFSGGMRQRIVIAIALTADPDILICDEPTTALDVTIQAQILELINKLKAARHMSVIFITHDLGVVANMADRVAVMYAGKIVEYGTAADVFYSPAHPYTWALLSSIPDIDS
ncbi:MAG: ABC transporter ATP-binding protein, partial [Bacilli bacterium]